MEREGFLNHVEYGRKEMAQAPAVESLLSMDKARETWPIEVVENKEFIEQVESRQELNDALDDIIDSIPRPDISIEDAINKGFISEQQAKRLYDILSKQFDSNPDLKRMALYLPFEYLPSQLNKFSKDFAQSAELFNHAFIKVWYELLNTHDVRANFVDGDVLELELREGDLPRVVKAAHLTLKLLEKGLISFDDVKNILKDTHDELLKKSILESMAVALDLGVISEAQLSAVQQEFQIEELVADKHDVVKVTERRQQWLDEVEHAKELEKMGEEISESIIKNNFSLPSSVNPEFVVGVRKAISTTEKFDFQKAKAIYSKYVETLTSAWKESNDLNLKKELKKTFNHLHSLSIISTEKLNSLGINLPELDAPSSEHLNNMESEMIDIKKMVKSIESDPMLSEYIYPVALVFGSRLKGYGEENSDLDVAILVKPGTPFASKDKITELLSKTFVNEKIDSSIKQFWLEDKDDHLEIIDFDDPSIELAKSYWTYALFGGVWQGNEQLISDLQKKLLTPYFYKGGQESFGREAHSLHLEEMERDNIQYRLMHKGYERFYPPFGGVKTAHSDRIDGQSMFWDSGFRTTATKLYASKVFIPNITK